MLRHQINVDSQSGLDASILPTPDLLDEHWSVSRSGSEGLAGLGDVLVISVTSRIVMS